MPISRALPILRDRLVATGVLTGHIGLGGGKITNCGSGAGWVGYGQASAVTVIEVAIGPGNAPGAFRVDVISPAVGEASATVGLDADSLLARRRQLQQELLASAAPVRGVPQ